MQCPRGIDSENPGEGISHAGRPVSVSRVTGPVKRTHQVLARDVAFLPGLTDKPIKVKVPGAFTMTRLIQDDYCHDEEVLIAAYTEAANPELKVLKRAGADIV